MKNYKYLICTFVFILLEELFFSFLTYKNFSLYIISFSLIYSIVIYIIYNILKKKSILYLFYSIILLLFISNFLYFKTYQSIISFKVFINSIKTICFYNIIIELIKNNLKEILFLFIPFLLVIFITKKIKIVENVNNKINYVIVFIIYVLTLFFVSFDFSNDIYSTYNLYFNDNFLVKNLYYFGLLTSKRLDIQKSIFNYNSDEEKIIINNENTYSNDEYNILDINFTFSDNNEINEINNYIKNSIPTRKNLFTGLLKNKNLIFILAESFNTIAINKEITPNLYKLYNEGFKFTNFYNPLYPVSTADGQYLTDISLFPSDSEHSLIKSNNNYYPYSLANIFNSNNYKSYSYHNYIYNYYERDKYYSNMGFDVYKGIGNGFDNEIVISDYDMLNNSIDEYIDEERFFTYYLTMSGHAPYSSNNKLCINNYEKLSNYNYSDATKYYLSSQIELDKMIGELFDKLEEKNKLEDTVIVLLPDHIPYGLTIDEINEISSIYKDNEFEKYRSSLIIYNNNINKYDESSNYCSNIDVLPTILNLFGIDYDSRLLMGKDILSNNDGIVIFGNRNIITKNYKYSNINEFFIGNINYKEISKIKDETYLKFKISRLILENNYYRFLE